MHNDPQPTDRRTNRPTDISIYRTPMELKIKVTEQCGEQKDLIVLTISKGEVSPACQSSVFAVV